MLNTITYGPELPDHRIQIKKKYIVIQLRNPYKNLGHVNSAIYVLEKMSNNFLFLRCATKQIYGAPLVLIIVPCKEGDGNFPVSGFTRLQFPDSVCFSITTNMAQGR